MRRSSLEFLAERRVHVEYRLRDLGHEEVSLGLVPAVIFIRSPLGLPRLLARLANNHIFGVHLAEAAVFLRTAGYSSLGVKRCIRRPVRKYMV